MRVPDPIPVLRVVDETGLTPTASNSAELAPFDLRWQRVEEFLRSRDLSPNTRKAYERDLRQFMQWTQKPWQEITAREVDRYKQHLQTRFAHPSVDERTVKNC
jgi:Phage integrase, N-terminal SAM-like domain